MDSHANKLLCVEDIVVRYDRADQSALDMLSFSIGKGEIFGLLGPNGAGKTTAISVMATLLRPCSGGLFFGGTDVIKNPLPMRKKLGLVPQDIALYPSLSGRENIHYFGRLHGLSGKKLRSRCQDCLEMVGLQDSADHPVSTYSGGMKRRANLAIGIVHKPELLFLDEPTVGIDAQSRSMILENLQKLNDDGMTMIYTTHYMEEAQQLCSRIVIIDNGRVLAEGKAKELIAMSEGCANLEDVFLHLTGRQLRD